MKGFRFSASLTPLVAATLVSQATAAAPQPGARMTPNFKDTDIQMIAEAVSAATGKNFIIDPRVRAQVTMLSSTPMSAQAFYQAFLSILEVYGFNAEPAGDVIKIVPDANARQHPGLDLPEHSPNSDEFETEVIDVRNVSASQLVPILRPMIPQYGHLAAYPASNILIISDRASNVNRMIRLIRRIDQVGDQDVEMMSLQNASAAEVVRVVNSLYQGQGAQAEAGAMVKVVADERSNSVLISGDQAHRLRLRAVVASLDTPLETGGDTRVRYLRYADAEKLAPKLKEQITGIAEAEAGAKGGAAGQAGASAQQAAEKNSMIWADTANNALVITAPPKIMKAINSIIDKLDILRAQVAIEAIIADVDTDKSSSLGVNWATFQKDGSSNIPIGAFVSPVGGTSIVDLAGAVENPSTVSNSLLNGATFGIGRIASAGVSFAAMLRALRSDSSTNIISTPSTITLDNQEAEMKSAEEVPFISGQYTSTAAATTSGVVTPFTTVQREEVGTILKVTPMISAEGRDVQLKISIEDSSLGNKPAGLTDFTTNKRSVSTTVRIEDGGIIVLGGLTKDQTTRNESRVPFLGQVPLVGLLFKSRDAEHTKNNLMIFIRPHIIRDASQTAEDTEGKYHYIEREQRRTTPRHELVPMLPFEKDPKLPPFPGVPPESRSDLAPASVEEKEKAARQQEAQDKAAAAGQQTTAPTPGAAPAPSVVPPLPNPPPR